MSGATETTAAFQITPVGNNEECIEIQRGIVQILYRFRGTRLLDVDQAKGIFTISTVEHPEVIRDAIRQNFRDKSVTLCGNHQCGNNYTEISQVIMKVAQSERIQTVEWTQNGLRINFYENVQPFAHVEYVPPMPSAPYQEDYVHGHPVGYSPIIEDEYRQVCTIV